jgi:hypothetical protein
MLRSTTYTRRTSRIVTGSSQIYDKGVEKTMFAALALGNLVT